MKELQIFDFEETSIRIVVIDDEPYFVGKDVAEVLGYRNTSKALKDQDPVGWLCERDAYERITR